MQVHKHRLEVVREEEITLGMFEKKFEVNV